MPTEAWLGGPIDGVPAELQPAAHMLAQSAVELNAALRVSSAELWDRPGGAASIGFHLRHIAGSIDRLLTYASGSPLSDAQWAARSEESSETGEAVADLVGAAGSAIARATEALRATSREAWFEPRLVGRDRLPTTVFGLLYHIAEHTVRHTGQVIATAKAVGKVVADAS